MSWPLAHICKVEHMKCGCKDYHPSPRILTQALSRSKSIFLWCFMIIFARIAWPNSWKRKQKAWKSLNVIKQAKLQGQQTVRIQVNSWKHIVCIRVSSYPFDILYANSVLRPSKNQQSSWYLLMSLLNARIVHAVNVQMDVRAFFYRFMHERFGFFISDLHCKWCEY